MDNSSFTLLAQPPALGFSEKDITYQADVVIIGAGAGGAAAAEIFSKEGLRVVVLEMGPKFSNFQKNYAHTARFHMQEGGAMVAQGNAMMPIAAGKGVGGSTLINSALSFRAPPSVLNHWADILQDERWNFESLSPIYDEISSFIGVGITPENIAGKNNELIVRGIKKLGYDGGLAPRNTPRCVGCGICYYGCPSGGKGSVNLNFMAVAQQHNTIIQAETHVEKLLIEQDTVVGVHGYCVDPETKKRGGTITVRAPKVVLSAGAIGTPRLLWHSKAVDILGHHVGNGLQVHPGSTLIGISDERIEMWKGATQGAYYHPPELEGVLPHTFSAPPEACLLAGGWVGSKFQEGLSLLPHMCGMLVMVSDKGNGSVRAKADGSADIHYYFHKKDIQRIKDGLVSVAKVLLEGGAKDLRAPIHGVGIINDPEELQTQLAPIDIADFTLYAAHPMGTCAMGLDPNTSVVQPTGETHRIKGLYISDASVFPSSLGVNPQLSTMVVSTVIARRILERG